MTNTHILSLSDINTTVNHEPRILDVRFAEALGFERPADIRPLIERHLAAMKRLGEVFRTVRKTSEKGGRPANEFYLNKRQAVYIASKSETENAVDLTIHVIEVFDAAMKGEAHPALPKTTVVRSHVRKLPEQPDVTALRTADDLKLVLDTIGIMKGALDALNYVRFPEAVGRLVYPHLSGLQHSAVNIERKLQEVQTDLAVRMAAQPPKMLSGGQLFAHTN